MNPFAQIGNFFAGLFGQKKEEEKRKPQVTTAIPQPSTSVLGVAPTSKPVGVQMPQPFTMGQIQTPQLGGVQQKPNPTPKPVTNKPTVAQPKPLTADLNMPGRPRNEMLDLRMKPAPQRVETQQPKQKTILDNVGDFLGDAWRNTTGMVNDFNTDPNNVPRNTINYILGIKNPLDGATLDYSKMVDGKPTLVPRGEAQNLQEKANESLGNTLINELFIKPTVQAGPRLFNTFTGGKAEDLPDWVKALNSEFGGYQNSELESNFAPGAGGEEANPLLGTLNTVGDAAALVPIVGSTIRGGIQGGSKLIGGISDIFQSLRPAERAIDTASDEASLLNDVLRNTPEGSPVAQPKLETPESPTVVRDPNSPITSPTEVAPKAPAITSPNQPAPTVELPKPFSIPETVGGAQPTIRGVQMPEVKAPVVTAPTRTADDMTAELQKAIDDAAVKQAEPTTPAEVLEVQTPKAQATQEIIEQTPPVNPQAVIDDAAAQALNDAPTETIADDLGTISRKAATEGRLNNDADAQLLSDRVGNAIEEAARKTGSTWEEINKKVQAAWSKGLKNYEEAGLTKEQFDVVRKAADELSLLRSRVDPSLLKEGQVGQFYSPRQAKDTEFTQDLVNEIARGKNGSGLRDNELDLTTTPYRQAIRRYSNAPEALGDNLVDALENKVVKDALGGERVVPTGVKVADDVKAALREDLKPFVKAQDDALRAADAGDAKGIDAAVRAGNKAIDDALNKMAEKIPKNTREARDAIGTLIAERRSYMQSTARTNMFTNIVNRAFDQTQKGIVNFTDQAVPLVNKITNLMTGSKQVGIATDLDSLKIARKFSKGTLTKQLNRNFETSVRLAGANARNPVTKGLAKADAAYRAAGTYLTSLGDLSTNAVKATNLVILGRGRAEGLKTAAELERYLSKNINTPEYIDIYRNMSNQYSGYIGMPQTLTSTGMKGSKASEFFSKIDNFVKNALDGAPIPNRVKQELNDIIMPAITGFAGATSRVAAKQLNALALGIPNITRGMKLAASDSPNAKAIGQMMISRSIIDGVAAGGIGVAGAMLGANGHWTGAYPSDPNERARWEKEGISPDAFQFQVGGKTLYIQPGRILGVLALPAVLPAVVAQSVRDGSDPGEAVSSILNGTIGQFNENLGADAIIQNIGAVNDLINGNESDKEQAAKKLTSMLGYSISNLNPAAGIQNNVANALDPNKRDAEGLVETIEARNPFTRPGLDVKKDNLGNDIKNKSQLSLGSAAVTVGDGQGESTPNANSESSIDLDAEINRLAKADFETVPARDVKNTNSQDDAKILLNSSIYKSADDETKASLLKDTLLGTKTKDINPKLAGADRAALIDYTIQDEAQRKVWLEDNDNANNYYLANYNNKVANNTLTSDDDNLENKLGAKYQSLRAQVNKEVGADAALKQLYEDISVEEWRAMIDPESEDYDEATAQKLAAYDEARTNAGVSGKSGNSSKPKYTQKKSGSGSGGKSFSFASMPASLIGVGGASSSKSAYADGAPTFKPIADLQTPSAKSIPKGRSISVKKGIVI